MILGEVRHQEKWRLVPTTDATKFRLGLTGCGLIYVLAVFPVAPPLRRSDAGDRDLGR